MPRAGATTARAWGERLERLYTLRPDAPLSLDDKTKGRLPDGTYPQKVTKYLTPKGANMQLDVPPTCRPDLANPAVALWVTEGQKKADALASVGCVGWHSGGMELARKEPARRSDRSCGLGRYRVNGREVRIAFDFDVMTKPEVQSALRR